MVVHDDGASLVLHGDVLAWTPFGYQQRRAAPGSTKVAALTPPSIIEALRSGYVAAIHPTARPN
jgi:hypothetical protein